MTHPVYRLLADNDAERPRSTSGFGPSGFYDCERRVALQHLGAEKVNETDRWLAIVGTAIHALYEQVRAGGPPDTDDEPWRATEVELHADGITGHADYIEGNLVEDLKTTTVAKISAIKRNGVPKSHLAQINWYAYAAGVKYWRLVYAPRDGGAKHWYTVEGVRDDNIVFDAYDWLDDILDDAEVGILPEPARPAQTFCRHYCAYYDANGVRGCPGMPRPVPVFVASNDPFLTPSEAAA